MADQGAASLSNIVVGIIVARALPAEGFGAFGLAWVAYLLAVGASRALIGEPLLSLYSQETSEERSRRVPDLVGATLTLSVGLAAVVGVVGVALAGPAGAALASLCFVLPLVLLEDTWRYVFVIERPGVALAMDVVWLVAVSVVVVQAPAGAGAAWFVVAWGASAAPALVLAAVVGRMSVRSIRPLRWLTDERVTGGRFFGEFLSAQAAGQMTLAALGGIAGMSALAGVRAVQILFGPLNTVHAGIYLAVVPDGVRARHDQPRLRRLLYSATALIVVLAVLWLIVCLVMPDSVGEKLFSATWFEGAGLVLPMGLATIAGSCATGGFAGVRSMGDAPASMRARLASLPGEAAFPLAGAWVNGAMGFVVGLLIARVVSAVIWWRAFHMAAGAAVDQGRVHSMAASEDVVPVAGSQV